jgi:hypothetical protein
MAACAVAACSPAQVGPTSATMVAQGLPPAPPPAPDTLPMPDLAVAWAPPVISAGDVGALADALGKHAHVELRLGPRLDDAALRSRASRVFTELSPKTRVDPGEGESRLRSLIPGQLPVARVASENDEDVGRPRYVADGVEVDVARWTPAQAQARSEAVLALDDAGVDADAWRRQPASAVGSCEPVLALLGAGQEQSLAVLEPFLDHADAMLWTLYRGELQRRLPELRAELSAFSQAKTRADFADEDAWETYTCGAAYLDYVEQYAVCLADGEACPYAPRVFLVDEARIGAAEPAGYIEGDCAARVGTDYVAQMRNVTRNATRSVGEMLDARWSSLADRVAALTEVAAAMDDVCTPRRRRFSPTATEEARARLAAIGERFHAPDPVRDGARWQLDDGDFRVPGMGAIQQLARFDPGPSAASRSVAQSARGLREFVLRSSMCGGGGAGLPLAAVLVDLEGKSVDFLGYFYEEELFCDQLPPLLAAG